MYLLNSFYKKESVVEKHHLQNEDSFKKTYHRDAFRIVKFFELNYTITSKRKGLGAKFSNTLKWWNINYNEKWNLNYKCNMVIRYHQIKMDFQQTLETIFFLRDDIFFDHSSIKNTTIFTHFTKSVVDKINKYDEIFN